MAQPPAAGRGPAGEPARGPELPGGASGGDGRDPRLAGFAAGGGGEACLPSAGLAAVVEELSGPEWRCPGAGDDELIGLLGRWEAIGAWAEAAKLGVVRELIRRRAQPGLGGRLAVHGDLPDTWHEGMAHEVSAALGISVRAADNLGVLAWDLQARLPGTGAALAAGRLSPLKARIVSEELKVLTDQQAAEAEKLILDELTPVTTPGQLGRLAAQVVCNVDPEGAAKRREYAEREEARVRFWRTNGGACALAGFGLPADAALAANDAVETRARQYKAARTRPDARTDQLRVLAFLDILNGISAGARLAQDRAGQAAQEQAPNGANGDGADDRGGDGGDGGGNDGAPDGDETAAAVPVQPALTARANLTLPLATLLGLAGRPGAAHGFGPLDPALTRDLAAATAASPHSQVCVTTTGPGGVAIGHGCAVPTRTAKRTKASSPPPSRDGPTAAWAFTPRGDPGPPGGYGTWTLMGL